LFVCLLVCFWFRLGSHYMTSETSNLNAACQCIVYISLYFTRHTGLVIFVLVKEIPVDMKALIFSGETRIAMHK
jgi:hypothetical protein